MNMKRITNFPMFGKFLSMTILATSLFLISCGDDDEDKTMTPDSTTGEMDVILGDEVEFEDTDNSATSRIWSITPTNDVDLPADLTAKTIKATFNAVGEYKVVVTRTFPDTFTNTTNSRTYTITVMPPLEVAFKAFRVNDDGSQGDELAAADDEMHELNLGDQVKFVNESDFDIPTTTWTFEGGTPGTANQNTFGTGDDFVVTYNEGGTFGVSVMIARDFNGTQQTTSVSFSDWVNVLAPLELDSATTIANGSGNSSIRLKYTRNIDDATVEASDFSVKVINLGVETTLTVSDASVSTDDERNIIIDMGEAFLSSDSVMVSYAGDIADTSGEEIAEFTDMFVDNHNNLVFGYAGFENLFIFDNTLFAGGYAQFLLFGDTKGDIEFIHQGKAHKVLLPNFDGDPVISEEKGASTIECANGLSCAHYINTKTTDYTDLGTGIVGADQKYRIENGKEYLISLKVNAISVGQRLNKDCTDPDATKCLVDPVLSIFIVDYIGWADVVSWNLKEVEASGWVTLTTTFTATDDSKDGSGNPVETYPFLRVAGVADIVVDDFYMAEVNRR